MAPLGMAKRLCTRLNHIDDLQGGTNQDSLNPCQTQRFHCKLLLLEFVPDHLLATRQFVRSRRGKLPFGIESESFLDGRLFISSLAILARYGHEGPNPDVKSVRSI